MQRDQALTSPASQPDATSASHSPPSAEEKDLQTLVDESSSDEGRSPRQEADRETPPDGGYGWVCVVCTALINAHTWGVNSSYGIFLSYYLSNNVFDGATPLDFALVGGLSVAAAMAISPLSTWTTRRFGTRTTLLLGVFFETLSLITASFTRQIWQLFLSQGLCFGIGMGLLFVGSVGIIPQWFTTKRSFANGIGTAGSGLGGLTYSLATGAMIETLGLAWTFRVLGIAAFVVNFVCAILIKDRNKAIGASQLAFDYRLFKRYEYCIMEAWGFFSMLGYIVLLFSLPNYAISIGLTPSQASTVGALLNLGQGIGRPIVGMFSDRAGRINIAAFLTAFCGVLCLVLWIFAKSYGVLIFFSLFAGTMAGTIWTTIGPVGAEVVGLKELPSALSITWIVFVVPSLFSEAIGLGIVSGSGTYIYAQVYTGLMYIIAGAFGWLLRAWKIGQLEMLAAEKDTPISQVETVQAVSLDRVTSKELRAKRSGLLGRLFMWKRV